MKFTISILMTFLFVSSSFAAYFIPEPSTSKQMVASAVDEYRGLSRKEKQERLREIKKELRHWRKNGAADEQTLLYVILAILLPPLAVYLHQGEINTKFWLSLILTLCFWLPGVIYSILVVLDQI